MYRPKSRPVTILWQSNRQIDVQIWLLQSMNFKMKELTDSITKILKLSTGAAAIIAGTSDTANPICVCSFASSEISVKSQSGNKLFNFTTDSRNGVISALISRFISSRIMRSWFEPSPNVMSPLVRAILLFGCLTRNIKINYCY